MLDPKDIAFIFSNPPDFKTGQSRGYTIGKIITRLPNGLPGRVVRETLTDEMGEQIAKVMAEKAKTEYDGRLVAPNGDALSNVLGKPVNLSGLDQVTKKDS